MIPDFTIIGAGIVGLLAARELAAAGARVTVLERGQPGAESSWAGGGILSPLYPWRYPEAVTRLAAASQAMWPELAEVLAGETGLDPQWTRSGLLIGDLDPGEVETGRRWATAHGIPLETLDEAGARAVEPGLGEVGPPVLWLPEVAQVRNPRLVQALRRALELQGVELRQGVEVQAIRTRDGGVRDLVTSSGTVPAGQVLVAAGAWSAGLLEPLGLVIPVRPVRGQMILFYGPPGLLHRIVLSRERYVIPRRDGHVLAGSTLEEAGFDKSVTREARQELMAEARRIAPALAGLPVVRQWAGLRPGSPTGVPFMGEHQEIKGLWVATGHYRNGLVLAPASARLVADLILGRTPALDPAPYSPGREAA